FEVQLLHDGMSLESRPELAILNGANAALVGSEIVQFTTASLTAPGRYRLAGLLRGRLGTERFMAAHGAGTRFVLLNGAVVAIERTLGALGAPRQFKAVGPNESIAAVPASSFTYDGENLRPLSPVHVRADRAPNGDATLTWIRRSRQGFDWVDGADAPLAEESERYELDILNAGTVVRTIATTGPQAFYSAADQQADFGAPQAVLNLNLYQISATVGRGAPLNATL
ncbi:MAG: hypothetical protein D6782_06970, partial [Alphaproteobacteria bacterium]